MLDSLPSSVAAMDDAGPDQQDRRVKQEGKIDTEKTRKCTENTTTFKNNLQKLCKKATLGSSVNMILLLFLITFSS